MPPRADATRAEGGARLLETSEAAGLLEGAARGAQLSGSVFERLADVQGLCADDLSWVEHELDRMGSEGEAPGTLAARHLIAAGGKRIRPVTVLLAAACFGRVSEATRALAVVSELVHSATLLHDDVIDDGDDRRGRVTARRVWGNAVSVLAGDLLLTHALDRTLAALPSAVPDLVKTLRRLVDGEILQLRGRSAIDVAEASYLRVLENKTASLFGWAARAGARSAGAPAGAVEALGRFGEHMGLAFQLVDDVLDYAGDPRETGKALLADAAEGKVTLPLVLALRVDPDLVRELDRSRAGDSAAAGRLAAAVVRFGVCSEVRARAAAETARALSVLSTLPRSPARETLALVAQELTARQA